MISNKVSKNEKSKKNPKINATERIPYLDSTINYHKTIKMTKHHLKKWKDIIQFIKRCTN